MDQFSVTSQAIQTVHDAIKIAARQYGDTDYGKLYDKAESDIVMQHRDILMNMRPFDFNNLLLHRFSNNTEIELLSMALKVTINDLNVQMQFDQKKTEELQQENAQLKQDTTHLKQKITNQDHVINLQGEQLEDMRRDFQSMTDNMPNLIDSHITPEMADKMV